MRTGNKNQNACTRCFNSLGVDSRMQIYNFLKEKGKSTVTSVVNMVELTQPTVSYHLKEMKEAGLLNSEKKGKEVYYEINHECPTHGSKCVLAEVTIPSS